MTTDLATSRRVVTVLAILLLGAAAGRRRPPPRTCACCPRRSPTSSRSSRRAARRSATAWPTSCSRSASRASPSSPASWCRPAAGNDTAARFALNAVAVYASQFGGEPQRALAERALIGALASASDVEVRTFLLSQLQLVGREPP